MIKNPAVYGDMQLDHAACGKVVEENTGKILAKKARHPNRKLDGSLNPGVYEPGTCIHADLAGPMFPLGIGGMKYILFAVDVETLYLFAVPLRTKAEAAEQLAALMTRVSVHACRDGNSVKYLHTDQGTAFDNAFMKDYCEKTGFDHHKTATASVCD